MKEKNKFSVVLIVFNDKYISDDPCESASILL